MYRPIHVNSHKFSVKLCGMYIPVGRKGLYSDKLLTITEFTYYITALFTRSLKTWNLLVCYDMSTANIYRPFEGSCCLNVRRWAKYKMCGLFSVWSYIQFCVLLYKHGRSCIRRLYVNVCWYTNMTLVVLDIILLLTFVWNKTNVDSILNYFFKAVMKKWRFRYFLWLRGIYKLRTLVINTNSHYYIAGFLRHKSSWKWDLYVFIFDVRWFLHHSTIHEKKPSKMQQSIKALFPIYVKLNMFRATHRPSSRA
jgi:hypothetical protein